MFSFKQLFNIFTIVNNNSEMFDRMGAAEEDIRKIYEELERQRNEDLDIRKYVDDKIQETMDFIHDN